MIHAASFTLADLARIVAERADAAPDQSYTAKLLAKGTAETAKKILRQVIPRIPAEPAWPEHRALDSALVTDRKLWPEATREKLGPILARFVG